MNTGMQKNRILVFAHEKDMHGASYSLLTILNGLKYKYDFRVIVPEKGKMEATLTENNIPSQVCQLPRCGYFTYNSIWHHLKMCSDYYRVLPSILSMYEKIALEFNPCLIYSNTSIIDIGFRLSQKLNIPHIWHIHEYGDLDFNIGYIPLRNLLKNKMKESHTCVYVTDALKKHWGVQSNNSLIVHNGIDSSNFNVNLLQKDDSYVFGIVGVVLETKKQLIAINVLEYLLLKQQKVSLAIIGGHYETNSYYQFLKKYIVSKNLSDSVVFFNYINQEEIYRNIDVLISCAENEAFGLTIIEAMSQGIPVVAKNSGGPSEIINHGVDGMLYNTIEEAGDTIIKLKSDSEFRLNLIENGKKTYLEKFTSSGYIKKMDKVFSNALTID